MDLFAVTRRRTDQWAQGKPLEEQESWQAHADYMDKLAADGFLRLAGPLEDFDEVLLIVRAEGAREVEAQLDSDPWTELGLLDTVRIARWTLRVGSLG